jgi:hypothetical protein
MERVPTCAIWTDHVSIPQSRKGNIMPSFTHTIARSAPFARQVAIAALMGIERAADKHAP